MKNIEKIIEREKNGFVYPLYESFCISSIPSTILNFFNINTKRPILPMEIYKNIEIENSSKIVLLLIDGLSYNDWIKNYEKFTFFNLLTKKGAVAPITSVFPSTTASALTTINTGLTPQEHALFEWVMYFKEIDMVINTLPFTPIDKKGQDKLLEIGVSPKILYKGNTIYQTLKKNGIKSFSFINESYAYSAYSKLMHKGSTIIPFINSSDLVVRLRKFIEEEDGYFHVYFDVIDAIEHKYGPKTEELRAELSVLSFLLKNELLKKIDRKVASETLFLIVSDHGQINISPKETIYLNKYKKLIKSFQSDKKNRPIPPIGSPRDVFLHIKQNCLEEIHAFVSEKLKEIAKVVKTRDAIKVGMFGIGKPVKIFYERVGDLLILPYKNHTVWYQHVKGKKTELLGHHGGLSNDEILVPFAISKLSSLI
ncbi:MAG: alkaline phosphatase family protein [Candidatus Aenigmatarchaeota archaeon]